MRQSYTSISVWQLLISNKKNNGAHGEQTGACQGQGKGGGKTGKGGQEVLISLLYINFQF